jgi:hypothetical protein
MDEIFKLFDISELSPINVNKPVESIQEKRRNIHEII